MNFLLEPVPLAAECAAGVALVVAVASRFSRRIRRVDREELPRYTELRRYTLLGTGTGGDPLLYETTRPPGTIISREIDGHREQFELTDVLLRDGTYAAEKLDRYV
jgi:hypothetical protein